MRRAALTLLLLIGLPGHGQDPMPPVPDTYGPPERGQIVLCDWPKCWVQFRAYAESERQQAVGICDGRNWWTFDLLPASEPNPLTLAAAWQGAGRKPPILLALVWLPSPHVAAWLVVDRMRSSTYAIRLYRDLPTALAERRLTSSLQCWFDARLTFYSLSTGGKVAKSGLDYGALPERVRETLTCVMPWPPDTFPNGPLSAGTVVPGPARGFKLTIIRDSLWRQKLGTWNLCYLWPAQERIEKDCGLACGYLLESLGLRAALRAPAILQR
jgi:hypothetical protein